MTHSPAAEDTASAILQQWDEGWHKAEFPRLVTDYYWAFIKARLLVFRTQEEWLTVFEIRVYYFGLGDFGSIIYAFGNRLTQPGLQPYVPPRTCSFVLGFLEDIKYAIERVSRRKQLAVSFAPINPFGLGVPPVSGDDDWCPDPYDFDVLINGSIQHFTATPRDYAAAGIDPEAALSGDRCTDRILAAGRLLASQLSPEQVFMPQEQLLKETGRPPTLPLFMELYDWCHPGIAGIDKPSDSSCLRSLAQAIAHRRPELYVCPADLVNTHWSKWPQFPAVTTD